MTYEQTVEKINSIGKFGLNASLERIEKILSKLGNPQKKLKFVHVAGTNGKGTCSSYIASCLTEAGYKTGLFTSPYVEVFTERFRINGKDIDKNELINCFEQVENIAKDIGEFTQFEIITAMAMLWFAKEKCDVVVLEVGLGGRFDATNIITNPLVSVIMAISKDHTAVLGNTVEKIAREKAGIIKENSQVVLYPLQEQEVFEVVKKVCKEKNASLSIPNEKIFVLEENLKGSVFQVEEIRIFIPFSGEYQILNASTALKAINVLKEQGFSIDYKAIIRGFEKTRIIARAELINENPVVILDGGHNEGCAIALKNLIEKHLKNKKLVGIIGMVKDKDSDAYLKNIAPLFEKIITVNIDNPRTINAEQLLLQAKNYCENVEKSENTTHAIEIVKNMKYDGLIVCGSLYLAGEIRRKLKENLF